MRITKIEIAYFAVFLVLLLLVFGLNVIAGGTITSPQNLATDLVSPPNSPQDWSIQDWAEVKYRAVFRLIIQWTWRIFYAPTDAEGFYVVFLFWSFAFFYGTQVALYYYLRTLDFDQRTSFIGCVLFLASPPVLLAYKYPVHTREDVLAYLLLVLGLIAAFKSRLVLVSIISAAAALTRETTLILPLSYFLASEASWPRRVFVWILPVVALVGIRILWGLSTADYFDSSLFNLQAPVETAAFLFCVFGVLWLPYLWGLYDRWRAGTFTNFGWKVLGVSGPIVFILVMGTTLVLSRAREIRIPFLLFPWAIPFALDWLRTNCGYLMSRVANRAAWLFLFAIFGSISALVLAFHLTNPDLMRSYLVDFKNGYWLVLGTLHLSLTLAFWLPMLRRQRTLVAV